MIRCLLYARTSYEPKNRHTFSIESQLDDEREWVRRLPGAVIVGEITDPDEKGPLLDRPGLNRVREMAHRGEFDLLVAHDMDRVARKTLLQLTLEEELQECEVQIAYVTVNYSNDDEGRLQKNVRAAVSEYERAKILERTLRGKRRKAREGLYPGGGRVPYGYRYDGTGALLVDPDEAAVVRLIFDLYVRQGQTLAEVQAELAHRHVPTHQGKAKWHRSTLRDILRNETYAGTGYYNRLRTVTPYSNKRRLRPREEWIAFETPALVDRATWEAAQRRLDQNRAQYRKRPREPFLLSGMIRCAPCDRAYSASTFNGWRNYRDCGERHKLLGAARTEAAVWSAIRELLLDPSSLLRGYERIQERREEEAKAQRGQAERLQRRKEKAQGKLDALTDTYLDDRARMPKEEYLRRRLRLLEEIAAIEGEEQALPQVQAPEVSPQQVYAAGAFAAQISQRIDALDQAQRRAVLRRLRLRVDVWPGERMELRGVFPAALSATSSSARQHDGVPFAIEIPLEARVRA